jgi:hypothetical protein
MQRLMDWVNRCCIQPSHQATSWERLQLDLPTRRGNCSGVVGAGCNATNAGYYHTSSDGMMLASSSGYGTVRLWDSLVTRKRSCHALKVELLAAGVPPPGRTLKRPNDGEIFLNQEQGLASDSRFATVLPSYRSFRRRLHRRHNVSCQSAQDTSTWCTRTLAAKATSVINMMAHSIRSGYFAGDSLALTQPASVRHFERS